jgi:hypothetical protein
MDKIAPFVLAPGNHSCYFSAKKNHRKNISDSCTFMLLLSGTQLLYTALYMVLDGNTTAN